MPAYASADRLVALGKRARADHAAAAMHHHEIGIGTDHREVAGATALEDRLVIRHRLVPAPRARVQDELGLCHVLDALEAEVRQHVVVARRADVVADPSERRVERIVASFQMLPDLLAGGEQLIIERAGNADLGDPLLDEMRAPRRVREDDQSPAAGFEPRQAIEHARKRRLPVVQYAPEVENVAVVAVGDLF